MRNRRAEGTMYEELACSYLRKKGYRILERNVYILKKEMDVVAMDGETVVFIEVKGRRSGKFGTPCEAVDRRKRSHMIGVAGAYLDKAGMRDKACRFDVVSVLVDNGEHARFEHISNAFEA